MIPKKGVVILVAIALVLAAIAISMNTQVSDEIPTKIETDKTPSSSAGQIGVTINPPVVEDKGAGELP